MLTGFLAFYWLFDLGGGFVLSPSYPSPSPWWVVLPTVEGLAYAFGIAWYDSSFAPRPAGVSGFIGRIGEYSYSIYLLHFFVVFYAARIVHTHVMDISNFYVACAWALVRMMRRTGDLGLAGEAEPLLSTTRLREGPIAALSQALRATLFSELGDAARAVSLAQSALSQEPRQLDALAAIAIASARLGLASDSIRAQQRLRELNPPRLRTSSRASS